VRIAPFCIPGSEELGESAIAAFGDDNCVALLQNHGPIAMGATLWHAFDAACAVEQAAKIHHIASHHGTPHLVPEEGRKVLRACDPLQQPDTGKVEIRAI
jgi:ribulose-5-phosphate 4-epimerase/fuculose-1-phosphate aldolase